VRSTAAEDGLGDRVTKAIPLAIAIETPIGRTHRFEFLVNIAHGEIGQYRKNKPVLNVLKAGPIVNHGENRLKNDCIPIQLSKPKILPRFGALGERRLEVKVSCAVKNGVHVF